MSKRMADLLLGGPVASPHVSKENWLMALRTEPKRMATTAQSGMVKLERVEYRASAGTEVFWSPSNQREIGSLAERVAKLESAHKVLHIPVTTFAPEPYKVVRPFEIAVESLEGEFVATFFEANISSSGENPTEAYANAKDMIIATFELLSKMDADELGPEPQRQLAVLGQVMGGR